MLFIDVVVNVIQCNLIPFYRRSLIQITLYHPIRFIVGPLYTMIELALPRTLNILYSLFSLLPI